MKRGSLLVALLSLASFSFATLESGCSGDSDDGGSPTPTCTPPPGIALAVQLHGEGAEAFAGKPCGLRILVGPSIVLTCSTGMVAVDGTFDLTGAANGPISNTRAELILSSDMNIAFGAGDRHFIFHVGTDGVLTGDLCDVDRGWEITADFSSVQSDVTWELGAGCPGK